MRNILKYIFILLVLASCGRHETYINKGSSGSGITADILLPITPIKDQGKSELCWIYAMLATLETDRIAVGDSLNLSPVWLARHSLMEQTQVAFLADHSISLRGTLPEAMRLMQTYGIVPWNSYPQDSAISSKVMCRRMMKLAKTQSAQRKGLRNLKEAANEMLDEELGPTPLHVFMLRAEYTPLEFAHSICLPGDWQAYTSFSHHPFGKAFAVEVPDNRQRHMAMNVRARSLLNIVVSSLRRRHPVAWEGCMRMENRENGNADVQQVRQRLFENRQLTDDHCMAIIGMGHDRSGTRYFICKNSWGKDDGNNGIRYMSEQEFLLSTIMIMVRRN